MRLGPVSLLVALALALPTAGPASAAPGGAPRDPALVQAEAALTSPAASGTTPAPDATTALLELGRAYPRLSPAEQRAADRLLARPTDKANDPEDDGYTVDEETPLCGATVCVHYVATTSDAASPAYAQQALDLAEQVNDTYTAAGYDRPAGDGALGGEQDKVDLYLADVGSKRLYGYCTSDQPGGFSVRTRWAYCVVDNDMAARQFPQHSPLENLQVTLAHEYFHAVQFGYDYWEDLWVMEATATWAEEQVFDDVDDNRQYLRSGQVGRPELPLDHFGQSAQYGNWAFFQFLSERWSGTTGTMPTIVLDLWERLGARPGDPDASSVAGIRHVLADRGRGFRSVYGRFVGALRYPEQRFSEGDAADYRPARPVRSRTLSRERRTTPRWTRRVDHLASQTVRIRPDRSLRSHHFTLRLRLEQPRDAKPMARVLIHRRNGAVSSTIVRPRVTRPKARIPFNRSVKYVEVVMANTSSALDNRPFLVRGRLVHD
ncbi:hypothetical protein GCM10009623_26300 [Nocardioides aestuarii]|uniref:MXAN_6640 family putative metalloprotease n=1 Tax=Nocardioides aestuarii TaxID=252231 RepID=A0ABW4TML0_9ACTN